eukprot:TRINITY_DN3906_c0_g1_i1.p1 TRINITY_DN3906_c0_g1~~TRINITY_DN3906_c0_g1_i1.p1  ORF type:complete len:300 (-),score=114.38 TRINITY_DN3906_c0_g1_i1:508-1407(-)
MRLKEFRVTLPCTVAQYQIGQLYSVAKSSQEETKKKGDGVEILENKPFEQEEESGQYTHKIYHIANRVPGWVRVLCPKSLLQLDEEAWNAYPHCKTVLTSPFFKKKLQIVVETIHLPGDGEEENVHKLDEAMLEIRELDVIDIALETVEKKDYKEDEDPTLVRVEKTGVGPLKENWKKECDPLMTCYKLVTAEFKKWGFQTKVENLIVKSQRNLFLKFHRQVYCWMDEWVDLTLEDIRRMEEETKRILDDKHALPSDVDTDADEPRIEEIDEKEEKEEKTGQEENEDKEKSAPEEEVKA